MNGICVTGFFSSGSSAVIDFLSEFDSTSFLNGREQYEHSLFYIGNGLFELYDCLFSDRSNYLSRSHALNDFVDLTINQYEKNYGWFGSYKKYIGKDFKSISDDFVSNISKSQGVAVDLADYKGVHFSLIKGILQIGAHFAYGYKISKFGRQYKKLNRPYRYLICTEKEFISHSQRYLEQYLNVCNVNRKKHVVFDHLVTAEQIYGVRAFLTNSYRTIVLDRNPVDIYLLSKYIWDTPKHYYHPPVPLNVKDFCNNYLFQRRNIDEIKKQKNVLYIRFEDLVLNYKDTTKQIMDFCGLKEKEHTKKKKYFNPEISQKNIGLDVIYPNESTNIKYILKSIPSDMYTYVRNKNIIRKEIF